MFLGNATPRPVQGVVFIKVLFSFFFPDTTCLGLPGRTADQARPLVNHPWPDRHIWHTWSVWVWDDDSRFWDSNEVKRALVGVDA